MNIIEIGGYDGYNTQKYLNENDDVCIWVFEPNPIMATELRRKFASNNKIIIIEKAVTDYTGKSKFNILNNQNSCSLHTLTEYGKSSTTLKFKNEIEVDTIRMDTFIENYNIDTIDFLHCDAQGSDLSILNSFGDKLSILKHGVVEANNSVRLYDVDNTTKSILKFLSNNDFKILNITNVDKMGFDVNIEFKKQF